MSRVPPEPLFHPSLLSLDNAAEEFWQEYKRKQLWADAHMRFHFPESESEADRKFIESGNKLIAANRALPKKRFSWAGILALLAVALVVGWMVYLAVEAF